MAATTAILERYKFGNGNAIVADITFDDSYPTGGELVGAGNFGLERLDLVIPASTGGYVFSYDYANKKLLAYSGALAQVADTTNLSAVTVRVVAVGK